LIPHSGSVLSVKASVYTFDHLADLYNQSRVDYIVPMPMNGKRMEEYVHWYDVDLDASAVALNSDGLETGLIMTGLRGDRSWATRLGVIPDRRGHHIGQYLMDLLIEESVKRRVRRVQLEVIKGNEPAIRLFQKLRFESVRELLIIRRPPGQPPTDLVPEGTEITLIAPSQIPGYLERREPNVAWTEETASLINSGSLQGLRVDLPSGESGWIVFQQTTFQLSHFVLNPNASDEVAQVLLCAVHRSYPKHDTKIENLPSDHPTWPTFQRMGYIEVFSRIEMYLHL
jgi:GNAT superfamily N-acetyltransferase